MSKKYKWYVVWEGTIPGICESWEECKLRVENYPNAKYKSYNTQEEAIRAYRGNPADEMGVLRAIANAPVQHINYESIPEIITNSLAVDAACSGNPGIMEYRGVDVMSGAELFHLGPFPKASNNIGEFLALVHGLAMLKKQGSPINTIYSDSVTAMAWVRDRKCKSKIDECAENAYLFSLVRRAEKWLRENTYTTRILKWRTVEWGEIPADFGRK